MAEEKTTTKSGIWTALIAAVGSIVVALITSGGWFNQRSISDDLQKENTKLKAQVNRLQAENEHLNGARSRTGPAEKPEPKQDPIGDPPPDKEISADAGGLTWHLQKCEIKPTLITCNLNVSSGHDQPLELWGSGWGNVTTTAFDQDGNEYRMSGVSIANKTETNLVRGLLIRNVRIAVQLKFDVNRDVKSISLLTLAGSADGKIFKAEFRGMNP